MWKIKTLRSYLIIFIAVTSACSTNSDLPAALTTHAASSSVAADPKITEIENEIAKNPEISRGYTALASVYIHKARETGDFSLNRKAEDAITTALKIAPDDLTARKLQLSLHATFHRFDEAIASGLQMEKEFPADAFIQGVLTDSYIVTGKYAEAVSAGQKMVDLKPNSSSYARVGHLRSLHGDHKGAVAMFEVAARTADPADREAQSWCLVHLAKEYIKTGEMDRAEKIIDEALALLPNYPLARYEKSHILAARGDYERALRTLERGEIDLTPHAYQLRGDIERKRGRAAEADLEYERSEASAQATDGDMHPFALWWADRGVRLKEALDIAEKDYETNKDIYGADYYAWALYKNGRFAEARSVIKQAMRLKTGDARIIFHAGMIENALGNKREARQYLEEALKTNAYFDLFHVEEARSVLRSL